MQQTRKSSQTKSAPNVEHFCILNQMMVHHIDLSWNTIEPSLVLMYEKLVMFGFTQSSMEIIIVEPVVSKDPEYHRSGHIQ